MWYFPFSAAINALVAIGLGIFILHTSRREQVHRAFVYFSFLVAAWSIGYFFWQISTTEEAALFWSRMLMLGAIYTPVTYLHFTYAFLGIYREKRVFLWLGYIFFIPFVLLGFSKYFVSHVEPFLGFPFWPMPGPLFHYFLLIWFAYLLYIVGLLISYYKISDGYRRSQMRYLFLGIFIAFVGGSMNYLPWYKIPILPYSNIFVAVYLSIFAYAITVYHLMDIKVIIRMGAVFTSLFSIVASIYFVIVALLSRFFEGPITIIIPAFIIALTFNPIRRYVEEVTDEIFFQKKYNFSKVINSFSEEIRRIGPDMRSILVFFDKAILNVLKIKSSAFAFGDGAEMMQFEKVLASGETKFIPLDEGSMIMEYFKNNLSGVLDIYEFENEEGGDGDLGRAIAEMKSFGFYVAVPITTKDKLILVYLLGEKKSRDMFYREDLELAGYAANEVAASIEKAQLYENLKLALESKSQFISVVSHQMRTPISAIRWSLELLQQKKLAAVKRKEFLNNAVHNSVFLVEQLDDVLTVLAIQDQEVSLVKEVCDVGAVADDLLHASAHEIEEKKLSLTFNFVALDMHASCDASKIRKVLGVLLKNAVTYTPVGGRIEISSHEERMNGKNYLIFAVKDSGIGLTLEEQKRVFDRFYRSDRARLILPDGMGLGMFIARTFVRAHGGSLWVESEGEGKGAAFFFSLPMEHPLDEKRGIGNKVLRIQPANFSYWDRFGRQAEIYINLASVVAEARTYGTTDDKSEFLTNLSHELKSPLSTIKFIAESMLHDPKHLTEADRSKIQSIGEAAERALNLSMDMIHVSKFVAGEIEPKFEMCDLKSIIDGIIRILEPASDAKKQKVIFEIPRDIHLVKICNEYLVRAFQNIFDNAISYGEENSQINITLEENPTHDAYLVSVHNEGPAIPTSELPKMFEKFHRVPGSERIKPTGTGLGLFIAKSAIELNGGKIWIESSLEKGTTVYFTVPFRAPRA